MSDLFASILDEQLSPTSPTSSATAAAAGVAKAGYDKLVAFGNLSSYSMDTVFHACPRKFQIKKLESALGQSTRTNSVTFSFGHAVGAGVAVFDQTRDLDQAIWAAFLAWDSDLLEVETKSRAGSTPKPTGKSFHGAIDALERYAQFFAEETNLGDYDTVHVEATFHVNFENGHHYVGHIDEVLKHRATGQYLVKENKTTGLSIVDPALYGNSDQALSYSTVVDQLGGQEYVVLYTIYSASSKRWIQFEFVKSAEKKAEWLQDKLLQHAQINDYSSLNFFPKRGSRCMDFMRRCEFYERCDMVNTAFAVKFSELPAMTQASQLQDIETVHYSFTLSQLLTRQKEKLNEY